MIRLKRARRGTWPVAVAIIMIALWVAPAAMAQSEYQAEIAILADQVTELSSRAQSVNQAWEDETSTFDETLAALRQIEVDTGVVVDDLNVLVPPDEFAAQHIELQNQADLMLIAADGMVDGLQSSDSGEARQTALVDYTNAANAFVATADSIVTGSPVPTSTTVDTGETPDTTAPGETTSTTESSSGTTATTSASTGTAITAQQPTEDGGTSTVTILITLLVGIAIGLLGGLLIGAQIRKDLMRQVRDAETQQQRQSTAPSSVRTIDNP